MEASHRRNNSLPLACRVLALAGLLLAASVAQAADGAATSPALFGIPVDFILFAADRKSVV